MRKLNVLVACEYSGHVREAFRKLGHNAWSCDLLPADDDSPYHYQGDLFDLIDQCMTAREFNRLGKSGAIYELPHHDEWDLLIAFPPCTYLTVSGAWLFADRDQIKRNVAEGVLTGVERKRARTEAVEFMRRLQECGIPHVACENPSRSFLCTHYRKPDCVVHPHQFGHDASKSTGLWLKNLPGLVDNPADHVAPRMVKQPSGKVLPRWANQTDSGQNCLSPGALRWKERSVTYMGIANAMANQWTAYILATEGPWIE